MLPYHTFNGRPKSSGEMGLILLASDKKVHSGGVQMILTESVSHLRIGLHRVESLQRHLGTAGVQFRRRCSFLDSQTVNGAK